MDSSRRKTVLALLALPAGCAFQPLSALRTEPLGMPANLPPLRSPALGQSWTYQKFNGYNSQLLATEREEVVALEPRIVLRRTAGPQQTLPEEQHLQWGQVLRDPTWDFVQNYESPLPIWPSPLAVGTTNAISTHYRLDNSSFRFWIRVQTAVKAWEKIYLPHGQFNALRIEKFIRLQHYDISRLDSIRKEIVWLVPEIGRWAAREIWGEYQIVGDLNYQGREDHFRWELTAWT